MKLSPRAIRWSFFTFTFGLILLGFVWMATRSHLYRTPRVGVTFSRVYAEEIGLNWKEAYTALVSDLKPQHLRLPIYWSKVEPMQGQWHFEEEDWMINLAREQGIPVTLAVGQKVPRWPECFLPDWAEALSTEGRQSAVLEELQTIVLRYRDEPTVVRWQVENEPFLDFGKCPPADPSFLTKEVDLVRSLSDKPIVMTTSGESEPWLQTLPYADQVGFSLYRLVWNPWIGFMIYPLQPSVYRARVASLKPFVEEVYVSELQAEPWFHRPIEALSIEDQHQMFSPRMLRENVAFAKRIDVPLIDLWGAEWWWYMKMHGDDSLWEEARKVF